ncbi:2-C-methyl-D-erythritol 4-phosphate cytidylyltransferase [Moraxella osloensis]|uniref:2-C-methyl-D-erythritol 4-phosphate cytidylyltransferase n=1 Tax=Faucicola osloensis TaxID=34062 RepID=A0AAW6TDV4_FAUOS|nr:2-C-methyl-D-erythritol 4-phosphate cytidylyltransferase [Moraxella osloensis]MDI4510641.1 2-C-methyl-D-erythritol 4-phosphate cytidylyltransferase [Moraxella osloensis]
MSEFNAIAANLSNNLTIDVVVVAAGVGKRFGSQMPKQYTHIGSQTVLQHSIAALSKVHQLSSCYLVISEEDTIAKTLGFSMPIKWVIGGKERMNSVFNAVQAIWQQYENSLSDKTSNDKAFNDKAFNEKASHHAYDNHWVLIHDAARPCVNPSDIEKLITQTTQQFLQQSHQQSKQKQGQESAGGLLAVPVRDTVKRIIHVQDQVLAQKTLDRSQLWLAQTPQIFPLATLYDYLTQAIEQTIAFTDEASLFEHFGKQPLLVEGSHSNIKLTFSEDLQFAQVYLAKP